MNKSQVEQSLIRFGTALPESPNWMIITTYEGELISQSGSYPFKYPTMLDNKRAAFWIHAHAMHELDTLEHITEGNLQCSVSFGTKGILFIANLNDAYFLGLSYTGVKSFDAIITGILRHSRPLIDDLYSP